VVVGQVVDEQIVQVERLRHGKPLQRRAWGT
jgi:hypothetical protein